MNRWINLKVAFHEVFGHVRCNLKEAVKLAGITWEGRAHCGLDDARNTARLLIQLMHRGVKLSITSSIECANTNSSSRVNSLNSTKNQKGKAVVDNFIKCSQSNFNGSMDNLNRSKKQKENAIIAPEIHFLKSPIKAKDKYCLCGVKSNMVMIRKPGPTKGKWFFGCGNWTPSRERTCGYFVWVS